jgi:hypothetical protein
MKVIHHLTPWRLVAAMAAAVMVGELAGWAITQQFNIRFPVVGVGAVSVGLAVAMISWLYDGRDDE